MTNDETLQADLFSMLRGNHWSHADAEQMASRLVQGIREVAKEITKDALIEHYIDYGHISREEY